MVRFKVYFWQANLMIKSTMNYIWTTWCKMESRTSHCFGLENGKISFDVQLQRSKTQTFALFENVLFFLTFLNYGRFLWKFGFFESTSTLKSVLNFFLKKFFRRVVFYEDSNLQAISFNLFPTCYCFFIFRHDFNYSIII